MTAVRDTSASVADVRVRPAARVRGVRIVISVEPGPPPSGVVSVHGGPEREFDRWLGLLRLLTDAVDAQPPAGPDGGLGGEVPSRGDAELGERV